MEHLTTRRTSNTGSLVSSLHAVRTRRLRLYAVRVTNGRYTNKTNWVRILYFRSSKICLCKIKDAKKPWAMTRPKHPQGGLTKMNETIKKNESNNDDKGYNKSNIRYGGNSRTASSSDTSSRIFEDEEPSIGVVLGLRFEKIRRKYPSRSSERIWVTTFQGPRSMITKW